MTTIRKNLPVSLVGRGQVAQRKAHSSKDSPGMLTRPLSLATTATARLTQHDIDEVLQILVLLIDLLTRYLEHRKLG